VDLVDEPDEPDRVLRRDIPVEGEPRHRSIQEPGVAEPIDEPLGDGRPDAALARGRRPVEGDDQASAVQRSGGGGPHRGLLD
jgi:hypothetical protein